MGELVQFDKCFGKGSVETPDWTDEEKLLALLAEDMLERKTLNTKK